jgi:hypothetical protein
MPAAKPIPPQNVVKKVLEDFELRMREILEGAWQDWQSMSHRALMSARSRASVIFDFIKARALAEFGGDPNIRALPKGQTVHFLFRDRVLVRFKKASPSGLGSNIETQAVIEFVDPQIPLFAMPPVYHVEVCYHLDKLATRMALLAVTARQRNTKLWAYELDRPASAAVIPLPEPPPADSTPPEVRPRKQIDKPDADSGE